ncbi:MAG: helicase HerA domain-containing protein, partial [Nostoc sp.]
LANFLQRRFTPTGATELTKKNLIQILEKAINVSLRHQQILSEMKLLPSPKTEKELWNDLTYCLGAKSVKVPHTLVFDDSGLREEINEAPPLKSQYIDQLHATSVLLNNGIPYADRQWVCLPSKNKEKKYVGVMTLAQKPEAFASTRDQVRFLWNVFSREVIYDVEIITEISPADQKLTRLTQQLITRRSRNAEISASKKTIDVASQINTEWSVNAQKQLYTGDTPENLALIVLVYRNSLEEIDDACRLISGYINQPTELIRETQYAWSIWLDTLLIKQKPQLTSPYNRRTTFFTSEIIGLTPVIQNMKADEKGFELIADEAHSPVWIDFSKTKNVMIIGTTGSGKSVLVSSIIAECLAKDMSILIIDLPNDDGSGTFGDFTPHYNGFYFDISRQSNNIVQPLDLSKIPLEQREDRVKAHRNDVNLIVLQLV